MANAATSSDPKRRRRGPVHLAELVGKVIDPVAAQRGFATADLIAAWTEIVGTRFADCSRPDRIVWPKGEANEKKPAHLVLRVDGPRAIYVQHEAGQIVERVNAYLGYAAIDRIRIVQGPLPRPAPKPSRKPAALGAEDAARLNASLAGFDDDGLRAALDRLGRGVLADKRG